MEQPIGIRLPKELMKAIEQLSKQKNEDRSTTIRNLVATGYKQLTKEEAAQEYIKGRITLSQASKKADLTLWEMESFLIQQGYKSDYSLEDLERSKTIKMNRTVAFVPCANIELKENKEIIGVEILKRTLDK